jgi:hypothetical protein
MVGMMQLGKRFVIFVSNGDEGTKQLSAVGNAIGRFELVAVDCEKGFADFRREDNTVVRAWLPKGFVRNGGAANASTMLAIPPLNTIKGIVGLDEAVAARGEAVVEKRAMDALNRSINDPNLTWEERTQLLADLISGKRQHIMVPAQGIDEAFAKKYGLTPEQVNTANQAVEIGRIFINNEKTAGTTHSSVPRGLKTLPSPVGSP